MAAIGDDALGAERAQRRQPVSRRIRVTNAAADGAAIAHGAVSDAAGNRPQNGQLLEAHPIILDVGGGDAGSDRDAARVVLDARQLGNGGDVDQDRRLHQAQVQHRAE
jgi:hypothetical protein